MNEILISVIIPVKNTSKYLNICLESILKNTYKNIEIIAIDDNSNDDSLNILKAYEKRYKKISIYHNNKTLGQSATRNIGLANAQGEYISFIDSDDYISSTMYQNMINKIKEHNYPDIIETNLIFVKDDHYYQKDLTFANSNRAIIINKKDNILNTSPSVCNKLFKKELIKNYKFINTKWEDTAFTTTMYLRANKIIKTFNPDYFYRKTKDGVSSINLKPNTKITEIFDVAEDIITQAKLLGKYDEYNEELITICFSLILKRIEEISYWNIEPHKKQQTKNMMHKYLYIKYGQINDKTRQNLITKVKEETIKEYENHIKEETKRSKTYV
jgi:glycosyltransferase involved in cell wall biosynthesis